MASFTVKGGGLYVCQRCLAFGCCTLGRGMHARTSSSQMSFDLLLLTVTAASATATSAVVLELQTSSHSVIHDCPVVRHALV